MKRMVLDILVILLFISCNSENNSQDVYVSTEDSFQKDFFWKYPIVKQLFTVG